MEGIRINNFDSLQTHAVLIHAKAAILNAFQVQPLNLNAFVRTAIRPSMKRRILMDVTRVRFIY